MTNQNIEFVKALRLKAASEAVAQEEDYAKLRAKNRDKTASSYKMALFTGGPVIQSRDDDVIVPTSRNPVKMYAGSSSKTSSSTDSQSVTEKQYRLVQLLTGGGR